MSVICAKTASATSARNAKRVGGVSVMNTRVVTATTSAIMIATTTAAVGKKDRSAAGKAALCLEDRKRKQSADASLSWLAQHKC